MDELDDILKLYRQPARTLAPKENDKQFRDFFTQKGFKVNRTFGKAINKGSLHPYGLAADIDFNGKSDDEIGDLVESALRKGYRVFDERVKQPGVKQTGPHLHFERNNGEKPSAFLNGRYGKRDLKYLTDLDNARLGKGIAPSKGETLDDIISLYTTPEVPAQTETLDDIIGLYAKPSPTNPVNPPKVNIPAPEAPETINAQIQSTLDPNSPKKGTLITPGEQIPTLGGLQVIDVPEGKLAVNPAKGQPRSLAEAIGKVQDVGNNTRGMTVFTTDAQGNELSASIVRDPKAAAEQVKLDKQMYPQAVNHELLPSEEVARRRAEITRNPFQSPDARQFPWSMMLPNEMPETQESIRDKREWEKWGPVYRQFLVDEKLEDSPEALKRFNTKMQALSATQREKTRKVARKSNLDAQVGSEEKTYKFDETGVLAFENGKKLFVDNSKEVPVNTTRFRDDEGETYLFDRTTGKLQDESLSDIADTFPVSRVPYTQKATTPLRQAQEHRAVQVARALATKYGMNEDDVYQWVMQRGFTDPEASKAQGRDVPLPEDRYYESDAQGLIRNQTNYNRQGSSIGAPGTKPPTGEISSSDTHSLTRRQMRELEAFTSEQKAKREQAVLKMISEGREPDAETLRRLGVSLDELRSKQYDEFEMARVKGRVNQADIDRFKAEYRSQGNDERLAELKALQRKGIGGKEVSTEIANYENRRREIAEEVRKYGGLFKEGGYAEKKYGYAPQTQTPEDIDRKVNAQIAKEIQAYGSITAFVNKQKKAEAEERARIERIKNDPTSKKVFEYVKGYSAGVAGSAVEGIGDLVKGFPIWTKPVADYIDSLFGTNHRDLKNHPFTQLGQGIKDAGQFIKDWQSRDYQKEFWAGSIPQGLGKSIAFMPAAAGGPLGISLFATMQMTGSSYDEAIEAGAKPETAEKYGQLVGGLLGWTERFGLGESWQRLIKGQGGKRIKGILLDALKESAEEVFVNELPQSLGQNYLAKLTFDPARQWDKDLADSLGAAGVSAPVASILISGLLHIKHRRQIAQVVKDDMVNGGPLVRDFGEGGVFVSGKQIQVTKELEPLLQKHREYQKEIQTGFDDIKEAKKRKEAAKFNDKPRYDRIIDDIRREQFRVMLEQQKVAGAIARLSGSVPSIVEQKESAEKQTQTQRITLKPLNETKAPTPQKPAPVDTKALVQDQPPSGDAPLVSSAPVPAPKARTGTNASGSTWTEVVKTKDDGSTKTTYDTFRPDGKKVTVGRRQFTKDELLKEFPLLPEYREDFEEYIEKYGDEILVREIREAADGRGGITLTVGGKEKGIDQTLELAFDRNQKPSAPVSETTQAPGGTSTAQPNAAEPKSVESLLKYYEEAPTDLIPEAPLRPSEKGFEIVSETGAKATTPVGQLKEQRDEERRKGNTDKLTGLANQNAWESAKERIEADPEQEVISIDVNRMKDVNDTTSHEGVNKTVLKPIGDAVQKVLEKHGIDARNGFRTGGDEFTIAVPKGKAQQVRDDIEKAFGVVNVTAEKDFTNTRTGESFKKGDVIPVTISGSFGQNIKEAEVELGKRKEESKKANPVQKVTTSTEGGNVPSQKGKKKILSTDPIYANIDTEKDSTNYQYVSNQLNKIEKMIDEATDPTVKAGLVKRQKQLQENHSVATKEYAADLKDNAKKEKQITDKWKKEASAATDEQLQTGLKNLKRVTDITSTNIGANVRQQIIEDEINRRQNVTTKEEGGNIPSQDKRPWEMSQEEFAKTATVKRQQPEVPFEQWAKENGYPEQVADETDKRHPNGISNKALKDKQNRLDNNLALRMEAREKYNALVESGKIKTVTRESTANTDNESDLASTRIQHKRAVKQALSEGKPVPPEVLADYPDLAPKQSAKQKLAEKVKQKDTLQAESKPQTETQPKGFEATYGIPAETVGTELERLKGTASHQRGNGVIGMAYRLVGGEVEIDQENLGDLAKSFVESYVGKRVARLDVEGEIVPVIPDKNAPKAKPGRRSVETVTTQERSRFALNRYIGEKGLVVATDGRQLVLLKDPSQKERQWYDSTTGEVVPQDKVGGAFPNYEMVVPKEETLSKSQPIDTQALINVAKRTIDISKNLDRRNPVPLKLKVGGEEYAFNPQYIYNGLRILQANGKNDVTVGLNEEYANGAFVFENDAGKYVVIPLRDGSVVQTFVAFPQEISVKKPTKGNKKGSPASLEMPAPDTDAFKKWFGDSKVVDKDGKPLVVYRGESGGSDFDIFDRAKTRESGFFFTPDAEIATIYARGKKPRQFFLKAEKLLDLTKDDIETRAWIDRWGENFDDWTDRRSGETVSPADAVQGGGLFDWEGDWSGERWKDLIATAEYEGYDGAIVPDWDNSKGIFPSYVVFSPTQIKSAIGNKGTFDPNNPSILEMPADAGSFKLQGDAQYAHPQDLLDRAKSSITDDGHIELNVEAGELLRRIAGKSNLFFALTHKKGTLIQLARKIDRKLDEFRKVGYSDAEIKVLSDLADQLREIAKSGAGVTYIFDFALPHETHHQMVLNALGDNVYPQEYIDQLSQFPVWKNPKVTQPTGQVSTFNKLYPNARGVTKAFEIAAMLDTGEIQSKDKERFLQLFAQGIRQASPEINEANFARIFQYDSTPSNARGDTETGSERQEDRSTGENDKGKLTQEEANQEAGTRPGDGQVQRPDSGTEVSVENKVVRQLADYDRLFKKRQYAETLRENGYEDTPDVPYIPDTEKKWLEDAQRRISASKHDDYRTAEKSFYEDNMEPQQRTALGIGLLDHLGSIGELDRMIKVSEELVKHVGTAAQALRASQLAGKYDFVTGMMIATRAVKKAGKELTAKDAEKVKELLTRIAQTEEEKASLTYLNQELETAVKEADKNIKELEGALAEAQAERKVDEKTIARLKRQIATLKENRPRTYHAKQKAELERAKPDLEKILREAFSLAMPSGEQSVTPDNYHEYEYPMASETVDGRTVRAGVPNMSSIGASLIDYDVLDGIREVPLSAFTPTQSYSASEKQRTEALAEEIRDSNEISPLIVVIDSEGPYILEGGHRFDALNILKAKSFPAKVVFDWDSIYPDSLEMPAPDTDAFKKWFGDSKVVDENGRPLVVYHGTPTGGFTEFDAGQSGRAGDPGIRGKGFYFSNNEGLADMYQTRPNHGRTGIPQTYPVYLSIRNPYDGNKDVLGLLGRGTDTSEIRRKIESSGYDGVIYILPDGKNIEFVAFNPNQIKSAIGNKGTFDPNNPSILEMPADDRVHNALVDMASLDILSHVSPEDTIEHLRDLTNNMLSEDELREIHLEAFGATKTESNITPEARKNSAIRMAHRRMAMQTAKPDVQKVRERPSRYDKEVITFGRNNGYTDKEILGAILFPKIKGAHSVNEWKKLVDGDDDTFKRSRELRQKVNNDIQDQIIKAKADREGYKGDLEKFKNKVIHNGIAGREARKAFDNYARKLSRSLGRKAFDFTSETISMFKGLSAWGEISYLLRQGFIPLVTDTRAAIKGDWKGVGHGLQGDNKLWQYLADKAGFENAAEYLSNHSLSVFVEQIRQHPRFLSAQNNGVRFTQIGDFNVADDHFATQMLEKVPFYRRAEVAYTLPGDLQRLYIYDTWATMLEQQNLSAEEMKKALKYTAEVANAFTGKGDVNRVLAKGGALSKALNLALFSPQLLFSRFQSLNKLTLGWATAPKGLKIQMAKKGLRFYGILAVIAALTGMVIDPEDEDFGKINIGDTHLDILAGLDVPAQLYLRTAMGFVKSVINQDTAYLADDIQANIREFGPRFVRSKLSPGASLAVDAYTGTDFIGRPFTWWGGLTSRSVPLAWQQTYDALLYDRYREMVKEPRTFEYAVNKFNEHERNYLNALMVMAGTFTGIGITQYPKADRSKAVQLAAQLSPFVSKKDAEQRRIEGGLRNLLADKFDLLKQGKDTRKVDAEIERWMRINPDLNKKFSAINTQANSKYGLLSLYIKDLNADQLKRVRSVSTDPGEIEIIDKRIKSIEK